MSAPIGTVERKAADGSTYFEIIDMGAYVKNAPDNNLTPDEMIEAFLEGVAIGRDERQYRKYLEYSHRYMLVNSGIDLIHLLKKGHHARVTDALYGAADEDDTAAERTGSPSQAQPSTEQLNQSHPTQPQAEGGGL